MLLWSLHRKLALCSLMLALACNAQDKDPEAPKPDDTPQLPVPAPHFAPEVGVPGLQPWSGPPPSLESRWKIRAGQSWDYHARQQMKSPLEGEPDVDARVVVKLTARDAQLVDATMEVSTQGGELAPTTLEAPGLVHRAGGLDREELFGTTALLAVWFSPPPNAMEIGESQREPVIMRPSTGDVPGERTSKLEGIVNCEGHPCAHFSTETILPWSRSLTAVGGVVVAVRTKGYLLFDLQDGSVFSYRGATFMSMETTGPLMTDMPTIELQQLNTLERGAKPRPQCSEDGVVRLAKDLRAVPPYEEAKMLRIRLPAICPLPEFVRDTVGLNDVATPYSGMLDSDDAQRNATAKRACPGVEDARRSLPLGSTPEGMWKLYEDCDFERYKLLRENERRTAPPRLDVFLAYQWLLDAGLSGPDANIIGRALMILDRTDRGPLQASSGDERD